MKPAAQPPAILSNYAQEISRTHATASMHAELAVILAVRVGLLCSQAKALVAHGEFGPWLEVNCPAINARTARRYLSLVDAKSDTVSVLPSPELLADDCLPRLLNDADYRRGIDAKVRAVVGDGSLSQLYRANGITPANPQTSAPSTGPARETEGIYSPHAVRLMFDRALKQTTERVPFDRWSKEMRAAWLDELAPIAELVKAIRDL